MLDTLLAVFIASIVSATHFYAEQHSTPLSIEQTRCLTEAVYYESRGEGPEGNAAVAYTVLNRTVEREVSICTVIHQYKQFSYYHPHELRHPHEVDAWVQAAYIAVYSQLGLVENPIGNATKYNTVKMPGWTDSVLSQKLGHHYFYVLKSDRSAAPLRPRPIAVVPLARLHAACLLWDPRCDPLRINSELSLDPRLVALLERDTHHQEIGSDQVATSGAPTVSAPRHRPLPLVLTANRISPVLTSRGHQHLHRDAHVRRDPGPQREHATTRTTHRHRA